MAPPSEICFHHQIPLPRSDTVYEEEEEEDEDEEDEFEGEEDEEEEMDEGEEVTVSSPLMMPTESTSRGGASVVEMVTGALRRSLMLCTSSGAREAAPEEDWAAAAGMQIGVPTDVRHVSHVTFDRFSGFLGLPADLEPEVPCPVPSARSAFVQVSDSFLFLWSIWIHE